MDSKKVGISNHPVSADENKPVDNYGSDRKDPYTSVRRSADTMSELFDD